LRIEPERTEIIFVPATVGRIVVDVRMTPGIKRDLIALDIRPVPACDAGLADQGVQAVLGVGIATNVKLIKIKHRPQPFDRLSRHRGARRAQLSQGGWRNKADQQTKNNDYQQNFEQGKPGLIRCTVRSDPDDPLSDAIKSSGGQPGTQARGRLSLFETTEGSA
jgi:hypothetical protein